MPVDLTTPQLVQAYIQLRDSGPRGRELAAVLDERGTHVRVSPLIVGGFTLNFINTIILQPLKPNASEWEWKYYVTLLGHEACHVEQRFWIDSVQQEIRAYTSQGIVGDDIGIDLGFIKHSFSNLNPDSPEHVRLAQAALLSLFVGQPAAIVYASLPLLQPRGLQNIGPALREIAAVIRAGLRPRPKPT
ncbi:MAG TPA: hypothetical protein VFD70_12145 [Anaerolineae bacterium]|nr:hypothetical protein [Anaerolineae bacterium]